MAHTPNDKSRLCELLGMAHDSNLGVFPSAPAADEAILERTRINLSWLLKLRSAAVAGQLATVCFVTAVLDIDLPLQSLLTVVGMAAISNVVFEVWSRRDLQSGQGRAWKRGRTNRWMGCVMVFDLFLLTALLYASGGPTNPFSIFYLVHITLAAVLLGGRWAYLLGTLSFACYAFLFVLHEPLPALGDLSELSLLALWRQGGQAAPIHLYLQGILIAFGAAAVIVVYFILRVSGELSRSERELARVRQRRAQSEKLEALATLSAGAAHELASPLSTIAVAARDLELHLERHAAGDRGGENANSAQEAVEDTKLIRSEVGRCREILDQMAAEAGQSAGEGLTRIRVGNFVDETLEALPGSGRIRVTVDDATRAVELFVGPSALARALRAIVSNALDASPKNEQVVVEGRSTASTVTLKVWDHGMGMAPEVLARAGNPFFTTKEPGRGMGLGLFLARTIIERLGGRLEIESVVGRGTIVMITLPLDRE